MIPHVLKKLKVNTASETGKDGKEVVETIAFHNELPVYAYHSYSFTTYLQNEVEESD